MAQDWERWKRKRFYFFIVDGSFSHDDLGWEFWFRTPLFFFHVYRNWENFTYISRTNGWSVGLITRWPIEDGGKMYRWMWKRETVAEQSNQQNQAVPDPNLISPKFFNQVSQIAHFFTTYAITLTMWLLNWKLGVTAFLGCICYAVGHEFWWDPTHENAATRGSDFEDFFWLCAGAFVALFVSLFLKR